MPHSSKRRAGRGRLRLGASRSSSRMLGRISSRMMGRITSRLAPLSASTAKWREEYLGSASFFPTDSSDSSFLLHELAQESTIRKLRPGAAVSSKQNTLVVLCEGALDGSLSLKPGECFWMKGQTSADRRLGLEGFLSKGPSTVLLLSQASIRKVFDSPCENLTPLLLSELPCPLPAFLCDLLCPALWCPAIQGSSIMGPSVSSNSYTRISPHPTSNNLISLTIVTGP